MRLGPGMGGELFFFCEGVVVLLLLLLLLLPLLLLLFLLLPPPLNPCPVFSPSYFHPHCIQPSILKKVKEIRQPVRFLRVEYRLAIEEEWGDDRREQNMRRLDEVVRRSTDPEDNPWWLHETEVSPGSVVVVVVVVGVPLIASLASSSAAVVVVVVVVIIITLPCLASPTNPLISFP